MKSAQRIYLTKDRKRAVAQGDKEAASLLVAEGGEISEEAAAKYEGAEALIGGGKKKVHASEKGHVQHRDPKSSK